MKAFLLSLSLLLLTTSCAIKSDNPNDAVARLEIRIKQTLIIDGKEVNSAQAIGSCSSSQIQFKNKFYILTAKHCLESGSQEVDFFGAKLNIKTEVIGLKLIQGKDSSSLDIKKIETASSGDVGVIKLSRKLLDTYLVLASSFPEIDTPIYMHGYPLGVTDIINVEGYSKDMTIPWYNGTARLVHINAAPGNSGGSVLNSNNEVIGILVAGDPRGQFLGFVTTVESIKAFLLEI